MTYTPTKGALRIIVGVDGSDGSKAALRWAMTQGRLAGTRVEAVATWQDPAIGMYAMGGMPAPYSDESLASITQKALDTTITEVSAELEQPVEVTTRVEEGNAALVLPAVSVGAQMLVVGSRGHGAFAGMVLGSVSQHCVQHLSCPVVVVPSTDK